MAGSVADTSVLAALIFQEQRATQACSLLANVELFEPPLLFFELANVCRKKIHRYPERTAELLSAFDIGLSLEIQWVDVDHRAVVDLALDRNLTTYDATLAWVSDTLGIPLHTFDDQLRNSLG